MKGKLIACLLLTLCSSTLFSTPMQSRLVDETIFTLNYLPGGGGVRPDVCLYIAMYMRELGIEVVVKVEEWSAWYIPPEFDDYDLGDFRIYMNRLEPDFNYLYDIPFWFGYDSDDYVFPYKEELEEMIRIGPTIKSREERIEYYKVLQELLMDKILMYKPLVTPKNSVCLWNNTLGYDEMWGLVESLPYMSFLGLHPGQESLEELWLADYNWNELNSLLIEDYVPGLSYTQYPQASKRLLEYLTEPLLKNDPYGYPTHNGLIENWIQRNDSHYEFLLNRDIYWNPSFNITGRTASSPTLNSSDITQLMMGLKGEYSNGTNQPLTAKDAVFTLLSLANPLVGRYPERYYWLSDVYVDETDPYAFHIIIDGNPATPELDYYSLIFQNLEQICLPEFFLNSSNPFVSNTTSGIECRGLYPGIEDTPEWLTYSYSAFGCGKFMLDYFIRNSVTGLRKSHYWFGKGAIDGQEDMTPFVDTITIRIIPDASATLAEFKAGKLEFASLSNFYEQRIMMEEDSKYLVYTIEPDYIDVLAFNLNHEGIGGDLNEQWLETEGYENYTKAIAIRKAICYAINSKEMGKIFFTDYSLSDCPIPPSLTDWYLEEITTKYDYDLMKSAEWLIAAGYNITLPTPTPTPTPTSTSTSTIPIMTTINLEILCSLLGIVMIYLLRNARKRRK